MTHPANTQPDPKGILTSLAHESELPVDEVAKLYEHERQELAADAKVTMYLQIFAIRNVKEVLRRRRSANTQQH